MIKLNYLFQDGMIIQRNKPFCIWGESDCAQEIFVYLNGVQIAQENVRIGKFSFTVQGQEACENATLQIGEVTLCNVDFGEVWLAGGQSNMQFYVKWDAERERIYACAPDQHIRYFEVAKYTFEGEEKDGFIDNSHWSKWLSFNPQNSRYFSAVATYFALKLKEALGVPVGIVSCSYGGTSASTWIDENYLQNDSQLKVYCDEYMENLFKLNMTRYFEVNKLMRKHSTANVEVIEDFIHRNVITETQLNDFIKANNNSESLKVNESFTQEELSWVGPNTPHVGSCYHVMLEKIIPFTCKGVLWYQGCSDEYHATLYKKLFTTLINCWRNVWGEDLPFIFAQLAPFDRWLGCCGNNYPIVRQAQFEVFQTVHKTFIVSTSDVGNKDDIHPKYKRAIGERMFYQAMDKLYGAPMLASAPTYKKAEVVDDKIVISFAYSQGLYIKGDIDALVLVINGVIVDQYDALAVGEKLIVTSPCIADAKQISIQFAQTGYYKVNLYNQADIPALPFACDLTLN